MKTIIVTGGAGFIGSHLTRRLVNEGNRVIVIDNLITTGSPNYIQDLILERKISFLQADICNPQLIFKVHSLLIDDSGDTTRIDEIYNLASPASVKLYTKFPELTFDTSTVGLKNIVNLAKVLGTKEVRILETSTSEIYGDPEVHPQVESYTGNVMTQCERSCYDEGKRGAEVIMYLAHKVHNLNTHIVRLFNVYGPNNTDDRVMPTFIQQAMAGEDITVFGDGKQTRSFCYVDDIVEGLIKTQDSDFHDPINLGNPEEISINELANIINGKFGNKSKVVYNPLPEGDPTRRCPDIRRAMRELNWHPTVTLSEGVGKVIEWMKSYTE
jgi:UDP-glucuronate decarboxylase